MKTCYKCKKYKSLSEYYADKNSKDEHRADCKDCKNEGTYKWRDENKEHYNKMMREYHREHYGTERLYRYNLSRADYNKMLEDQKGCCALCGKTNPSKKRSLAIDHCHSTGKVRGILCYGCNRLMVLLDNEDLLNKALAYKAK